MLRQEKTALEQKNAELERNMKAVADYLKPNWSNDMHWCDEIIIAIDQRHSELVEKVEDLEEKLEISEAEKRSFSRSDNSRIRSLESENALLRKRLEPIEKYWRNSKSIKYVEITSAHAAIKECMEMKEGK